MKKRVLIIGLLFGIIILNFNIGKVIASDSDDDGIEDSYEDLNKRVVEIEFKENETQVESVLRTGRQKDSIEFNIKYDSDGVDIDIGYESEFSSVAPELEIEFGIQFRELIEFVDLNSNGIYDPSVDDTIQEVELISFQPIIYTAFDISTETIMHYFIVNTTDGIFTAHIYLVEEFAIVNGTLITPVKAKIDLEITNFNFLNDSSHIALYTKLKSGEDYQEEDNTEDEKEGYATGEKGVLTRRETHTGIFTWKENATIDGVSKEVLTSAIEVDDDDENEQKFYLSYLNGTHIYHDPKIGLSGILRLEISPLLPILIILILIIGSVGISVAYSVYHYRETIFPTLFSEVNKQRDQNKKPIKKSQSHEYKGGILLKKVKDLTDSNITAISEDFLDQVSLFEWEGNDREAFVEEMLSLTPGERQLILNEMIEKSDYKIT